MLLSGGVSMGEYDLVEEVLRALGAEFFFTGVRMQPGKPVVFGRLPAMDGLPAQYFFGLPGNPVSTQVTFHCFVEPLLRGDGRGGRAWPPICPGHSSRGRDGKAWIDAGPAGPSDSGPVAARGEAGELAGVG